MIYLSGPMTGLPGLNRRAFANARRSARAFFGDEVISPPHLDEEDAPCATWEACLERDLLYVIKSDVIVMLPGWENSQGAKLEHYVAKKLGKRILSYPGYEPL